MGSIAAWFGMIHSKMTVLFMIVFVSGCATESRRPEALLYPGAIERRCGPESGVEQTGLRMSLVQKSSQGKTDFGAADWPAGRFSLQSQDIADTIGAKDLLTQMAAPEAEASPTMPDSAIRFLLLRQQLSDRILLGAVHK